MTTPAAIPRSPFVPRTAQPPYSHVGNSTRGELDRLGLTALRAMVHVEPYGSTDLGRDPSDDEPASMTSASPSEDDDPAPMILAAVFSQNSKSCIFSTAISNCTQ